MSPPRVTVTFNNEFAIGYSQQTRKICAAVAWGRDGGELYIPIHRGKTPCVSPQQTAKRRAEPDLLLDRDGGGMQGGITWSPKLLDTGSALGDNRVGCCGGFPDVDMLTRDLVA